jgi:hypothetical protein
VGGIHTITNSGLIEQSIGKKNQAGSLLKFLNLRFGLTIIHHFLQGISKIPYVSVLYLSKLRKRRNGNIGIVHGIQPAILFHTIETTQTWLHACTAFQT